MVERFDTNSGFVVGRDDVGYGVWRFEDIDTGEPLERFSDDDEAYEAAAERWRQLSRADRRVRRPPIEWVKRGFIASATLWIVAPDPQRRLPRGRAVRSIAHSPSRGSSGGRRGRACRGAPDARAGWHLRRDVARFPPTIGRGGERQRSLREEDGGRRLRSGRRPPAVQPHRNPCEPTHAGRSACFGFGAPASRATQEPCPYSDTRAGRRNERTPRAAVGSRPLSRWGPRRATGCSPGSGDQELSVSGGHGPLRRDRILNLREHSTGSSPR